MGGDWPTLSRLGCEHLGDILVEGGELEKRRDPGRRHGDGEAVAQSGKSQGEGPHAEQTHGSTLERDLKATMETGEPGYQILCSRPQRCTNVCKAGRKWTPKQARAGKAGGEGLDGKAEE